VPNPTRIGNIDIKVHLPAGIPEEKYDAFMATVKQCLVHNTFCSCPLITMTLE
jgi:radical SAM superfamily enzyme